MPALPRKGRLRGALAKTGQTKAAAAKSQWTWTLPIPKIAWLYGASRWHADVPQYALPTAVWHTVVTDCGIYLTKFFEKPGLNRKKYNFLLSNYRMWVFFPCFPCDLWLILSRNAARESTNHGTHRQDTEWESRGEMFYKNSNNKNRKGGETWLQIKI